MQGLFLTRQKEVSKEFCSYISKNVLNSGEIWKNILTQSASKEKLVKIVSKNAPFLSFSGNSQYLYRAACCVHKYLLLAAFPPSSSHPSLPSRADYLFECSIFGPEDCTTCTIFGPVFNIRSSVQYKGQYYLYTTFLIRKCCH